MRRRSGLPIRHLPAVLAVSAALVACLSRPAAPPPAGPVPVVVAQPAPARCDADLATSPTNCGACGNVCPVATRCSAGVCAPTVALAAGGAHTCMITSRREVRCWGANAEGQLGLGHLSPSELPATVPGLRDVVQIAAGGEQTCAINAGGQVWCWGAPLRKPFDSPHVPGRPSPVRTEPLSPAKQIAVAGAHACALGDEGAVACWGVNHEGQLGDGTQKDSELPVSVVLPWSASGIAVAAYASCAWSTPTGEIACWGMYHATTPDDPSSRYLAAPKVVRKIDGVLQVSVGTDHVCARTASQVTCWRSVRRFDDPSPKLGQATTLAGAEDAVDLRTSGSQTCALRRGGGIVCFGQAWTRIQNRIREHLAEQDTAGADALAVGGQHLCVRRGDGRVACWGANDAGQLGDGTPEPRTRPVLVLAPGSEPPLPSDNGAGDACATDADCTWDDPCAPSRCGSPKKPLLPSSPTTCAAPAAPSGSCACLKNRCVLHPSTPPAPPSESCEWDTCGLDEARGRCLVGRGTATNPRSRLAEGPYCACNERSRCSFEWVTPVPCRGDDDCWLTGGGSSGPPHAIRRPREIHKGFRPCHDGETAPACRDGVCTFGRVYGC